MHRQVINRPKIWKMRYIFSNFPFLYLFSLFPLLPLSSGHSSIPTTRPPPWMRPFVLYLPWCKLRRKMNIAGRLLISFSIMVLTLDGNSELGAHVRSNLCFFFLFFFKDIRLDWKQLQIWIFFLEKPIFPHRFATYSEWPSNISTMSSKERLQGRKRTREIIDWANIWQFRYSNVRNADIMSSL